MLCTPHTFSSASLGIMPSDVFLYSSFLYHWSVGHINILKNLRKKSNQTKPCPWTCVSGTIPSIPFLHSQAVLLEKELCMCALFVILFLLHACTVLFVFILSDPISETAHWSHPDLVVILNRQYRLCLMSPLLHFTWLLLFSKLLDSLITVSSDSPFVCCFSTLSVPFLLTAS